MPSWPQSPSDYQNSSTQLLRRRTRRFLGVPSSNVWAELIYDLMSGFCPTVPPTNSIATIASKDVGSGNNPKWLFGYANNYGGVLTLKFVRANTLSLVVACVGIGIIALMLLHDAVPCFVNGLIQQGAHNIVPLFNTCKNA